MARSATSSVSAPKVAVTCTPRARQYAKSTASVPTPLTATTLSLGSCSSIAREMPVCPPVMVASMDAPCSRSQFSLSETSKNLWTV
jgi:hypothetical protein